LKDKKYPWQFSKPYDYNEKPDYKHWDGNPMLELLRSMERAEPNDQQLGKRLRAYIRSLG